ncbi:MAG: hypothetical protein WBK28_01975 [Minisyncoccia bacterium]
MSLVLELSGWVLSAGWFISGILFVVQYLKILKTKSARDVYWPTFFGFSLLNANAALYGYLHGEYFWLPGTILASTSCALISFEAYKDRRSRK